MPPVRKAMLRGVVRLSAIAAIVALALGAASPQATAAYFTAGKAVTGNSLTAATLEAPANFRDDWSSTAGHRLSWADVYGQTWAADNRVTTGVTYRVTRHVGSYAARDIYSGTGRSYTDSDPRPSSVRYVSVVAGQQHTLAIDENGAIWAWGSGGQGALGNNSTANSSSPVKVILPAGRTAKQIAAGTWWSATLLDDGTVWTWGANESGQLGIGNTQDQLLPQRVSFPSGVSIRSLASVSGYTATMGVVDTYGTMWIWGNNVTGTLGNGSFTNSSVPILVRDLRVSSLAIQGGNAMATGLDGRVWAWGRNRYGAVGNHSNVDQPTPYHVTIPNASPITQVMPAAFGASFVLEQNGTLWAWGTVWVDGHKWPGDPIQVPKPDLDSGSRITQVAVNYYGQVEARLGDGRMLRRGSDANGWLWLEFDNTLRDTSVTAVAVGGTYTFALTTESTGSRLWQWKQDDLQQVWSPTTCPYSTRASGSSCVWDGELLYTLDYTYQSWRSDYSVANY